MLCASIPATPTNVVASIEGPIVNIYWTLSSTNGSPITEYKVFVKESGSSTYTQESVDCNGKSDSVIKE